jgi:coenzyme F420-reducing hydrogenase beta subunit
MKTVCKENQCAGCMACVDICPKQCIEIKDDLEYMNAVIDPDICIHCNACHRVCQVNHPANLQAPIKWFQGWAEKDIRRKSSSGGFSSAIEQSFIQNRGVVAACKLVDGDYRFVLANSVDDLIGVAGSKYVKSNPVGIYKKVKQELISGKKVLFLGLPCQVSSMRNFIGEKYSDNLYTIDLICHGTPSIKILRKALKEYHVDIYKQKEILFRRNDRFFLESDLKRITPVGIEDFYTTAFMRGIDYTENCYACHYATGERVSDLTLGDSWGSEIHEEEHNGISLALVQTSKGEDLLNMAGVELHEVDLDKAKVPNTQLRHPTVKGNDHDTFFRHLMKGQSFKRSVIAVWPKQCIKQEIKIALIKLGIYHRGG